MIHVLGIHTRHVHDFVPPTVVTEHIQREAIITQRKAETTRKFRITITQIDHIILVDASVVVDILVDGITPLELVFGRTVVIVHRFHRTVEIRHRDSVLITGHRHRLTFCHRLVVTVVTVGIYPLVTEPIDGTERVAFLQTRIVSPVSEVGMVVEVVQHTRIETANHVLVGSKVCIDVQRELTFFHHLVEIDRKFPTVIIHSPHVFVSQCGEAGRRRNVDIFKQKIVCTLFVPVVNDRHLSVPKFHVETQVQRSHLLPFQPVQTDTCGINGTHVHIACRIRRQYTILKVILSGLPTGDTPTRTESQQGQHFSRVLLQPRFVRDNPFATHSREKSVTVGRTELCGTVHTKIGIKDITPLETVVHTSHPT